ncbi:Histone-lysine N-methyltransferase SETMAR [Dufourea novaeangliae]|uniref:Histone-lysine N-methyltransferase SETMAR n=1 Tax=Dufourea novaeangliae TaxID=178035 RepID=A0A154PUG7_DUFNO|nr:Histone-lysine N-methyltransferase SETMAR [Dufourea novaeangliae]
MAKLHEIGFELIPPPPYSPDLAPTDFLFLLRNLKIWLSGKKFSSNEDAIAAVNTYFAAFNKYFFSTG